MLTALRIHTEQGLRGSYTIGFMFSNQHAAGLEKNAHWYWPRGEAVRSLFLDMQVTAAEGGWRWARSQHCLMVKRV